MLGASAALFYEGVSRNLIGTMVGALLGAFFIVATRVVLGQRDEPRLGSLTGASGKKALMIVGVMTVHSFTEGAAIGVALAAEGSLGLLIALAIAFHNIPEGLAIALSLVPSGEKVRTAALWSIFTSLPQPLMAVPAFVAVKLFEPLLPAGLGFAGGAMLWMVATQLVPESLAETSPVATYVPLTLATAGMMGLEIAVGI